jgi:hypothetical protein
MNDINPKEHSLTRSHLPLDELSARAAVADPSTPASVLAEIAASYPQAWDSIAVHPNVYPELVAWMHDARARQQSHPFQQADPHQQEPRRAPHHDTQHHHSEQKSTRPAGLHILTIGAGLIVLVLCILAVFNAVSASTGSRSQHGGNEASSSDSFDDEPEAEEDVVDLSPLYANDGVLCTDVTLRKEQLRETTIGCISPEHLEPVAAEIEEALRGSGFYVFAILGDPERSAVIMADDFNCDLTPDLLVWSPTAGSFLIPATAASSGSTMNRDSYTVPVSTAAEALQAYLQEPFQC